MERVAETRRTFQDGGSPGPSPQRDIGLGNLGSEVSRQRSVLVLMLSEAFHLSSLGIPNGGVEHYRQSLRLWYKKLVAYRIVLRSLLLLLPFLCKWQRCIREK